MFVGVFHPANVALSVTTTRWAIVHSHCLRHVLLRPARNGRSLRQAGKEVGWLGLVGYVFLSLWLVLIMGFSFVEAFILPRLATTDPKFVEGWMGMLVGPASKVYLGALPGFWTLTAPIYILGGVLFGIATFRAGILPRWAGALLAIGTALAPIAAALPNASQPKIAIPVGLALAWLGYALWSEQRARAS